MPAFAGTASCASNMLHIMTYTKLPSSISRFDPEHPLPTVEPNQAPTGNTPPTVAPTVPSFRAGTTQEMWDEIHRLHKLGKTRGEIGLAVGLTPQAAAAYLLRDRPTRIRKVWRNAGPTPVCECGAPISHVSKNCRACSVNEAAQATEHHRTLLRRHIAESGKVPTCLEAAEILGLSRSRAGDILKDVTGPQKDVVRDHDPEVFEAAVKARHTWRQGWTQSGMVYAIQAGESGPIKIGRASDPAKRRTELQAGHYEVLRLIAVIDPGRSAQKTEKALHASLVEHRIRGEWFHPHPEVLELVAGLNIAEVAA